MELMMPREARCKVSGTCLVCGDILLGQSRQVSCVLLPHHTPRYQFQITISKGGSNVWILRQRIGDTELKKYVWPMMLCVITILS